MESAGAVGYDLQRNTYLERNPSELVKPMVCTFKGVEMKSSDSRSRLRSEEDVGDAKQHAFLSEEQGLRKKGGHLLTHVQTRIQNSEWTSIVAR